MPMDNWQDTQGNRRRGGRNRRPPFRGNFSQHQLSQAAENPHFEQQYNSPYRSFSKGQEVDTNVQKSRSLYEQRTYVSRRSRGQIMSHSNINYRERGVEHYRQGDGQEIATNRTSRLEYQRLGSMPQINSFDNQIHATDENIEACASIFPSKDECLSLQNNAAPCFSTTALIEARANYERQLRLSKPTDIILNYRQQIEKIVGESIKYNLHAIEQISSWESQNDQSDVYKAHLRNLHLQREEFENYVTKVKQRLPSPSTSNIHDILKASDLILADVKRECKLFNRCLPGYSLKSNILNKLTENQVIIITSDSTYYLNIVLPIFLKKEYPEHALFSCETNEILRTSLKGNVTSLIPNDPEEPDNNDRSKIQFVTDNEMLGLLLKENAISNFISVCSLPLKRSIVVDLVLSNLRDLLEDQDDCKLILLLSPYDNSLMYENYFSDLDVDVITTVPLSFTVNTVFKTVPLLPFDDYIEDAINTAISIHTLKDEGDVMIFLPTVTEAKSALVCLIKKLPELRINDIDCILLHETSPDKNCLNMSYKKTSAKRTIFFVTDCGELFVINSIRYVIDCGLRKEYVFDSNKKLDVFTTSFISYDKAKLRKKLAGAFLDGGVCYRLYSKENICKDMPSRECPEILTINPFNAMIKLFQYQPCTATRIEFVESLSDTAKTRALNLLKKANAVMKNKLTPLGERIIKLPFPPMYSKLILLGIEWELAYEATVLVAFFSVKGRLFKFKDDMVFLRKIDAVKLELMQGDSDTLSYIYIYRLWLENEDDASWCDKHFINSETLKLVHKKVLEICQIIGETVKKNIVPEFSKVEDVSTLLIELLFDCFKENLCVFTGHYRSGYRMLSSRSISFLHPSSIICQNNNLPEFIIFDHMISSKRDFLIHITTIPRNIVVNAVTNHTLDFDYSDMFEKSLVQRVIEPVGERMIKQVLLGKKGHKLKQIEHEVMMNLGNESVVIEPSAERGRIAVYALESCIDDAVQVIKDIMKREFENILLSETTHILELKKDQIIIPVELKCLKGAKVESVKVKPQVGVTSANNVRNLKQSDELPYSIKKSIHINWIRRKCNGTAEVNFLPDCFRLARRLAMKHIDILGAKVFVTATENENKLILSGVPEEAEKDDVERDFGNNYRTIFFKNIELKYGPPFETSQNQLQEIKKIIEDECQKYTELVDFNIVIPICKPTATKMKAYINVPDDELIVSAAESLSKNLKMFSGVTSKPVYSSVIKCSFKMCKALEPCFKEKLSKLEQDIIARFPDVKTPFKFDIMPVENCIPSIKMAANRLEILQALQRTIFNLLEGDILTKSFNKDINKIFCHGGSLWLRTLEDSTRVHIIDDYRTKSIKLYGPKERCDFVKQRILEFLLDTENEDKIIPLATEGNNRILLKTLLIEYGVNLEGFINSCGLRSAVLNIKSCSLTLHGNRHNIEKAEGILKDLATSIDLSSFSDALEDGEICPVCVCPVLNSTCRLEMCGHLYCSECIQGLVDQPEFPIKCCAENCNKDILLDDINKALGDDPVKLNVLLEKSMKNYIEEHSADIYYCPTPDCSMFFFKIDIPESKHNCPLCLNDICVKSGRKRQLNVNDALNAILQSKKMVDVII